MTVRPYINAGGSDISLNDGAGATGTNCTSEDIDKTQPMIAASSAGGDTKDNLLATLMSGTRTISAKGYAVFSSQANLDAWFHSIDSLVVGARLTSVKYYAQTIQTPYAAGNSYFNGFISSFKVSKTDEEGGGIKVNYEFEFTEGTGLSG